TRRDSYGFRNKYCGWGGAPVLISLPTRPYFHTERRLEQRLKYWEIIADDLKKRGWSLGYVSAVDSEGRAIWIADAHRGDGKRFVMHADELLTAFLELEAAVRACGKSD
ncbi:MAG: hypothetical protein WAN04_03355, partial [Candidatus Udaeobacter sp.]